MTSSLTQRRKNPFGIPWQRQLFVVKTQCMRNCSKFLTYFQLLCQVQTNKTMTKVGRAIR